MNLHTLQGFTMYIDGTGFHTDTKSVTLPVITPMQNEYRGGGMALAVNLIHASLEPMESQISMHGHNPELMKYLSKGPGQRRRVQFRSAVLNEETGIVVPHVAIVSGSLVMTSRGEMSRGSDSGTEFKITGVDYFRFDVGQNIQEEVSASPPRWISDGIDQLAAINAALGI
jgi:uncharacterized protein